MIGFICMILTLKECYRIDINGVFNEFLYDVTVSDSIYPLYVTFMCNIGTQITILSLKAVTDNGIAAYFTTDSENGGSYESYTMFYHNI